MPLKKRRSPSRERLRKLSPSPKKRSLSPDSSKSPQKKSKSPKKSRHRSESRSLSYSPARRNPERYREVLEKKHSDKVKKPQPIVKLHPTSSDRESSDNEAHSLKSIDKVDEFLQIDKDQETEKELNMLKALKSGLANKVKQNLEQKKIISETLVSLASEKKSPVLEHGRVREMNIAAQARSQDTSEVFPHKTKDDFRKKITIKPFKLSETSPLKAEEKKLDQRSDEKEVRVEEKSDRKSRSRSTSSHR
jgi:serine/arginine repetitive matrix protein 2